MLEKSWYKKRCYPPSVGEKFGLRKTVYPAWMGGNLFIRPGSVKCWSEETCLFGLSSVERWAGKKLSIRPESGNICLSGLRLSKVNNQTWVSREKDGFCNIYKYYTYIRKYKNSGNAFCS